MSAHTNSAQSILFDYRPHFCNQYLQDYRHGRIFTHFWVPTSICKTSSFMAARATPLHLSFFHRLSLRPCHRGQNGYKPLWVHSFLPLASPVSQSQRPSRKSVFSVFSGINPVWEDCRPLEYFCGSITAWGSGLFSLLANKSATCVLVLIQEHQFPLKVQHFFQYNHSWAQKIQILDQKRGCAPERAGILPKEPKSRHNKSSPKELASATTYKPPSEQELPFVNQLLKALFFVSAVLNIARYSPERFSGSTLVCLVQKPQR